MSNLVGGCLVFLTHPFEEGDKISMDKLPASKVLKIGWHDTAVLGDDEEVSNAFELLYAKLI